MRNFTMFSIALGNLKHRKRQYLSLAAGIVLAIFFTATIFLLAAEWLMSMEQEGSERYGRQDVILFACPKEISQELVQSGILVRAEEVDIVAQVLPDGKTEQNGFALGTMNGASAELAGKTLKQGEFPKKEGEIALEWNALAKLRTPAQLGDELTLTLRIPDGRGGYLPQTREKTYRLAGILQDQYPFLEDRGQENVAQAYPTGIVAGPVSPDGGAMHNVYGMLAHKDEGNIAKFMEYCQQNGVDVALNAQNSLIDGMEGQEQTLFLFVFMGVICAILVAASCLWIVDAFSANLEGRKHQIGLLRAVGATRRQIRRIFVRETLLLAALTIPLALGLSCVCVALVVHLMGEGFTFHLSALVLLVAALFGVLVVFLASLVPLRRVASIPPMQAIRNVDLARKMKRSKGIRPKREYRLPELLAERNMRLYPARQVRISLLLAISIAMFSVVSFVTFPVIRQEMMDDASDSGDYMLMVNNWQMDPFFDVEYGKPGMTQSDRMEIEELPNVKETSGEKLFSPKILLDEITPYVGYGNDMANIAWDEYQDWYSGDWIENQQHTLYEEVRQTYGYAREFLPVQCVGIDSAALQKLEPYVLEGEINLQKLAAGEEVLVVAPAEYGIRKSGEWGLKVDYTLSPQESYVFTAQNDTFHAGDELHLSLLYSREEWQQPEELPRDAVRQDTTVRIGALIDPGLVDQSLVEQFDYFFSGNVGDIITTCEGIEAMGYQVPYGSLKIALEEPPDTQLEIYLEEQLEWVAARTQNCEVRSYIAIERENRQTTFGLIVIAYALVILFFAICTSMVNNVLSARIRAGKRQIGTLRAVGASERDILHSFHLQMLSMLVVGTVLGIGLELALCSYLASVYPELEQNVLPIWQPVAFVALIAGVCWWSIRKKVRKMLATSIVSNIREL